MVHDLTRGGEWILIALVMAGAIPEVSAAWQFLMVAGHFWRNHYAACEPVFPRTAILIPAWNEAAVIGASIDRLMALEYPPDSLRIYLVDDASTDQTPQVAKAKEAQYPGQVIHLRREKGGEGKAHTLNHGLGIIMRDDWMEALLITDADVIFEADSLRKMTRHLADPLVGAVTAYIKEGCRPGNYLTRFIGYEYITAQAASRRGQNVLGAIACLAGGAQLHSRANLVALGGRIDTSSLAEDTFTTFETQLRGRRVVFEPHAVCWAEEPGAIGALWKQYFANFPAAWTTFRLLWIVNAASYIFITGFALLIDVPTARHTWRQGVMFPGVVNLSVIGYTCFPRLFRDILHQLSAVTHLSLQAHKGWIVVFIYAWLSVSMGVAYLAKAVEPHRFGRFISVFLVYIVGYGALLCACTFASYVKEMRGAEMKWDKTEKTGKMAIPT
jgi:cellulose synthase/poly-beta-1,6-N-acetylglucosamine synthase-like glycosyltransferase